MNEANDKTHYFAFLSVYMHSLYVQFPNSSFLHSYIQKHYSDFFSLFQVLISTPILNVQLILSFLKNQLVSKQFVTTLQGSTLSPSMDYYQFTSLLSLALDDDRPQVLHKNDSLDYQTKRKQTENTTQFLYLQLVSVCYKGQL